MIASIDFHPASLVPLQAVELEENILGAILLDPNAIAAVAGLSIQAFSVSAHRKIFMVMLELHRSGLQPDLLAVTFRLSEQGALESIGGRTKLALILERMVHSGNIKQYASLLLEQYHRHLLLDRIDRMGQLATKGNNLASSVEELQSELDRIRSVTSDSSSGSDELNLDPTVLSATVTSVTKLLAKGLPQWEEQAHLDALQQRSGISKAAFWQLVASQRIPSEEVMPQDEQQLERFIQWKDCKLDFQLTLPHLAEDLLHDGRVLNIDPIMLWQYLLCAILSLVGKKNVLDVGSHKIPAIAWTCSVAESGTGKSRAEGLILSPLKAWQEQEHNRFKTEWQQYKQSQNKKDNADESAAPMPERKFLFEVATIQAVMKRLSEQGENGSLWARDEIAGLFKSLGQFTSKGEGEGLECLLPMWDGASAPVDRVMHEDSYYLASSRLSIAGGLQPGVFRKIFQDPDDAQGLQARFLFALPKVQPAKRVEGYCRLAEQLPRFYRWIDTQFPAGIVKLSSAADARYGTVYEQIGQQAELAETPAIRAWMRKLPGQLLRIALALHIIECYHEPQRPRHEIQLDTLNRAVDFCRYYRSTFEIVQHSATDSDAISSVLTKIWDLAATSPNGLVVRDAYRNIKALQRRAKEIGRNVAAYTIDLYYKLEAMGKGIVQKSGRVVRFVAGAANAPQLDVNRIELVTVETFPETTQIQQLQASPQNEVSPVTNLSAGQLNADVNCNDMNGSQTQSDPRMDLVNEASSNEPDSERAIERNVEACVPDVAIASDSTGIPSEIEIVSDRLNSIPIAQASPAQVQSSLAARELATTILQCITWIEIASRVQENTHTLVKAAKEMTAAQRQGLTKLLSEHLCQSPAHLNQLAWVPEKLRQRTLERLQFTIRRIANVAGNVLDLSWESISGCRLEKIGRIGMPGEAWLFTAPDGTHVYAYPDAVEAISYSYYGKS
ncbi:hypothetical protein C7B80_21770 [Cyanosarcina cf. burmensis CCALA 770]|nr:hypothetical protein C7B80_21770 [Cyanosarcina cf. burmensis CCALA 770]